MLVGNSTDRVLLDRALGESCGQACVDWAVRMLSAGYSGRSLTMLAGMSPPFNHFEIKELEDQALQELGIDDPPRGVAIGRYAAELLASRLGNETEIISALSVLKNIVVEGDHPKEIYDFYLLYFAYQDLKESEHQWYWEGANRSNIWEIIQERVHCHISQWGKDV